MPRPDKEINPGRLDGPISASRRYSWTKYGEAETADSSLDPADTVEITVDDITVTQSSNELSSKYVTRGTAAHGTGMPEPEFKRPASEYVKEWVVDRTVEGRTYRRVDRQIMVELKG